MVTQRHTIRARAAETVRERWEYSSPTGHVLIVSRLSLGSQALILELPGDAVESTRTPMSDRAALAYMLDLHARLLAAGWQAECLLRTA